jgi:hypothetical protein
LRPRPTRASPVPQDAALQTGFAPRLLGRRHPHRFLQSGCSSGTHCSDVNCRAVASMRIPPDRSSGPSTPTRAFSFGESSGHLDPSLVSRLYKKRYFADRDRHVHYLGRALFHGLLATLNLSRSGSPSRMNIHHRSMPDASGSLDPVLLPAAAVGPIAVFRDEAFWSKVAGRAE